MSPRLRLVIILVAIGLFVLVGPVGAADQLQHALAHTFGDVFGQGCGGG